jgi:hypothetical protein
LIPCHIERHSVILEHARRPKLGFDCRWGCPVSPRHFLMPGFQRTFRFGVPFPECAKGPFGNDSHGATVPRSQYGSNRASGKKNRCQKSCPKPEPSRSCWEYGEDRDILHFWLWRATGRSHHVLGERIKVVRPRGVPKIKS